MYQRRLAPFIAALRRLLARLGALLAARIPSAAVPQANQGLQYGAVIDDTGHILLHDEALNLMAQAGAGWVKLNFRLGGFVNWTETSTFGYSALSLYDQIVANARTRNLTVLGELSNEAWHGVLADWQANSAEAGGGNGDNTYLQQFAQSAAVVLAQHYAGQIDVWEVWNEPSQAATYLYPSNFAQLLAHVYTEIRAAGVSSAVLVSGGITSLQDPTGQITLASSGAEYLQQVYLQGKSLAGWEPIKGTYGTYPLDRIGQHIYIDGFARTTASAIRTALEYVRDAYVAAEGGSTTKLTVITEFGWASNNVSERIQASNLQTAYSEFQTTSYVEKAYWFFLRDEPGPGLYFGLLRPNSSRKPAWKAYQTYANY